MFYRTLALFAAIASVVRADMVPTSPDGATIAKVGDELTTLWTKDTTGTWNDVTIQLMTGDNWQMVPVSTLETGVDATTLDSYTFTVPEVTPTSKIYFLQFTPNTGNATQVTWTTRFTIAGADGSTSTPTESTQPDGQSIPWGTGQLVGAATTGTGASNSSISAAASSISASASAIIASASSTIASAAESAASEVESVTSMASASGAMSSMRTSSQASSTRSVAAASATTSTAGNGAGHVQVTGLGVVGLVAGLVAFLA